MDVLCINVNGLIIISLLGVALLSLIHKLNEIRSSQMFVLWKRKSEDPEKNLSEQGREPID